MLCPVCGNKMQIKTNNQTKEKFLGCSDFPKCKCTTSYIDPKENEKIIREVINKYEQDIRNKLELPIYVKVTHEFNYDMEYAAICMPTNRNKYIIRWNIELKRNTLAKILLDLAHEYRHVYQVYFETFSNQYDTSAKWRTRPEEDDAINFSYKYLDEIISNYTFI